MGGEGEGKREIGGKGRLPEFVSFNWQRAPPRPPTTAAISPRLPLHSTPSFLLQSVAAMIIIVTLCFIN